MQVWTYVSMAACIYTLIYKRGVYSYMDACFHAYIRASVACVCVRVACVVRKCEFAYTMSV